MSSQAEKNALASNFIDDVTEAYHEVMELPFGEGLVGKKFPWNWYAACRAGGGEAWCKGNTKKKIRSHWVTWTKVLVRQSDETTDAYALHAG